MIEWLMMDAHPSAVHGTPQAALGLMSLSEDSCTAWAVHQAREAQQGCNEVAESRSCKDAVPGVQQ